MRKINRIESFRYAFSGIWYTIKTQRNAQIHLLIASIVLILGITLKISLIEWAIIALTIGFVIVTEMLNTVAEATMDYLSTDFHPQIKVIKDMAAGAVLISAMIAVVIGCLIFGPPLFQTFLQ